MNYATVCSGIGAPETAWHDFDGWQCVFQSEIEKFPSAVLAERFPGVPNYGDMTQFKEWPDHDNIGLICGGTPCQSFSVAGLRKGLDDPRGNLMLTYLAIAAKYRPKWLVWENVPGVLSSNEGRDFGTFLGALGELGYGWAYRVLDAQCVRVDGYEYAVPQRRRRVFVVGYLGDWHPAAAVLFERQSLQGHSAPSREARENVATGPATRAGASGGDACANHEGRKAKASGEGKGSTSPWPAEIAAPLNTSWGKRSPGSQAQEWDSAKGSHFIPEVAQPVRTNIYNNSDPGMEAKGLIPETSRTLNSRHDSSYCADRGMDIIPETCGTLSDGAHMGGGLTDRMRTQGASSPCRMVAFGEYAQDGTASALKQRDYKDATDLIPQGGAFDVANIRAEHDASEDGTGRGTPIVFEPGVMSRDGGHVYTDGAAPTCRKEPGDNHPCVMFDSDQQQGIMHRNQGGDYADAEKARSREVLRALRESIGEEAFVAWGIRIAFAFQPSKVLRESLHGEGVRLASWSRCWMVYCSLSRKEDRAEGALQSVREAQRDGCTPFGWQRTEQRTEQLGAYLSELSQPGAQQAQVLHDLWQAAEGSRLLRKALSTMEEVRRPIADQDQPAHAGLTVRRLTAEECEFLQGFPRGHTRIAWRGKAPEDCPDGPRYKALGNSMACNVMRWIGRRIQMVEEIGKESAE